MRLSRVPDEASLMTWECLACGEMNPDHNRQCGSVRCQERRLAVDTSPEAVTEAVTEAVKAVGEARKGLGSKTSTSKATPHRKRHTYSEAFEQFMQVYPKKRGKLEAYRMWKRYVVEAGVDVEAVIEAAKRYADDPTREDQFTKYPSGWLSAGRWEDEPYQPKGIAAVPAIGTPEYEEQREAEWKRAEGHD
jgi:acyl-CoA reductase-like NAD-dependent aldehyde dehydrogenase